MYSVTPTLPARKQRHWPVVLAWCFGTMAVVLLLRPMFPQSGTSTFDRWLPSDVEHFLKDYSLNRIIRYLILALVLSVVQMLVLWRRFRYAWVWCLLTGLGWFVVWSYLWPLDRSQQRFTSTWEHNLLTIALPLFPYSIGIGLIQSLFFAPYTWRAVSWVLWSQLAFSLSELMLRHIDFAHRFIPSIFDPLLPPYSYAEHFRSQRPFIDFLNNHRWFVSWSIYTVVTALGLWWILRGITYGGDGRAVRRIGVARPSTENHLQQSVSAAADNAADI